MVKRGHWYLVLGVIILIIGIFSIFISIRTKKVGDEFNSAINSTNLPMTDVPSPPASFDFNPQSIENTTACGNNSNAEETLRTLSASTVPERDPYLINKRFKNEPNPEKSNLVFNREYKIGAEREFWVLNSTTNTYQQVKANLLSITPHSYFWVQNNIPIEKDDVIAVSRIFENKVYPTDHAFFGSEPNPGIDGDEHISILYTQGMGQAAGLFSSSDSVTKDVDAYSNQAEMFYISADYVDLSRHDYVAGIMAHEFQHLIHYYHDRNEVSWINEGFSELAIALNGYGSSDFDYFFAYNPNTQLTFWPGNEQGDSSPNYGAAFMFMKYFLDRFGEKATKRLVAEPANDYQSVDLVLKQLNINDPMTQYALNGDDLFRDWSITNLIHNEPANREERYKYQKYDPPHFHTEKLNETISNWANNEVSQFGTQYFEISCQQDCLLELQGTPTVKILPENPHSGNYMIWSNKGDESEMTFSREFDFRDISAPITLQYWTWYDIETDYDYLYLTASEDGEHWKIINTPRCTLSNPTGANFGCGYSGKSKGWVLENVDLSDFAGKKVILRFDYITDLAVNGEGFALDDIAIPAIGYSSDFESDLGGWQANGFVRIQNELPQEYLITHIQIGQDIKIIPLFFDCSGKINVNILAVRGGNRNFLIISGITRYTTTPAEYEFRLLSVNKP